MPNPDPNDLANAIVKGVTEAMRQSKKGEEQKSAATKIVELIGDSGCKVVVDQYREAYLVPPPEWIDSAKLSDKLGHNSGFVSVGNVGNATVLLNYNVGGVGVINKDYKSPTLPTLPTLPGRALSITGSILEALIAKEFHKRHGKVPGPAAIKSALITIRGQHLSEPSTEFWNRIGVDDKDNWWLDLSNGLYVWITSSGWDVLEETPLYFRRHSYQLPLHTPTKEGEGDLFSLLDFINLPDCDSQLLYLVCALQCLVPDIPKAILNITGGYGTVKSTGMGAIVEIFDRTSMKEGLPGGFLRCMRTLRNLCRTLITIGSATLTTSVH